MQLRTEIEPAPKGTLPIDHGENIVMLGSCFTDNIGALLQRDGFNVTANPLGPLYNPASIANTVERAMSRQPFCEADYHDGDDGRKHCLWFASRYSADDTDTLSQSLNHDFLALADGMSEASTVIITLGTAFVFALAENGWIVGNCHKFPASSFLRRRLTVPETAGCLLRILRALRGKRVIFTVSPVRHTADTLHGNQLSKATLLLGIDSIASDPEYGVCAEYFPAYEILNDDLRDYRFYASDMKHPSDTAVEYVYEKFCNTYFTPSTAEKAKKAGKEAARKAHRPLFMQ